MGLKIKGQPLTKSSKSPVPNFVSNKSTIFRGLEDNTGKLVNKYHTIDIHHSVESYLLRELKVPESLINETPGIAMAKTKKIMDTLNKGADNAEILPELVHGGVSLIDNTPTGLANYLRLKENIPPRSLLSADEKVQKLHEIYTQTNPEGGMGTGDFEGPHSIRKYLVTSLCEASANPYHIKEIMNWESLRPLKSYAKLSVDGIRDTLIKCHPMNKQAS